MAFKTKRWTRKMNRLVGFLAVKTHKLKYSEWPWLYVVPGIAITTNSKVEGDWCQFVLIVSYLRTTWVFKFGVKKPND